MEPLDRRISRMKRTVDEVVELALDGERRKADYYKSIEILRRVEKYLETGEGEKDVLLEDVKEFLYS